MTNTPLSEAAIKDIVDGMPDGLNGFTKHWGWLQFARKIEAAHGITQQTTMSTPPTIKAGQRLLIRHPKLGLREAKVLETNGDYAKLLHEGDSLGGWMAINWLLSELVSILPDQRQSMADAVREASKIEYGPRHSTYIDGFLQSQDTCSFQFPLPSSPFPKGYDTYTRSSHENLSPIVSGSLLRIAGINQHSSSFSGTQPRCNKCGGRGYMYAPGKFICENQHCEVLRFTK